MGWRYVGGDLHPPAKTGRASFAEVVQQGTLRLQLYALNLRDVAGVAQPWLDDERLSQAVDTITRITTGYDPEQIGAVPLRGSAAQAPPPKKVNENHSHLAYTYAPARNPRNAYAGGIQPKTKNTSEDTL